MATSSTSISGSTQTFIDLSTKSIHEQVDTYVQTDASSPIGLFTEKNFQALICSNYPKCEKVAHDIFCDAFGYRQNDQVQIVAIADGCNWGPKPQRAARLMIDEFFAKLQPSSSNGGFFAKFKSTKEKVDKAAQNALETAQKAHLEMKKRHDDLDSNNNYYGGTTFLGGQIFTPTKGKRFFAGVNCGDCKLYHLKNGMWEDTTPSVRLNPKDSGGRFCPNREEKDKTEYPVQFEVNSGDKLLFMTDGVYDNLDRVPKKVTDSKTDPAEVLSTLQRFRQDENLGMAIMQDVLMYTAPYLQALEEGKDMNDSTIPGKPDHMTILIVTVQ